MSDLVTRTPETTLAPVAAPVATPLAAPLAAPAVAPPAGTGPVPRIAIEVDPAAARESALLRGAYRVFEVAVSAVALVLTLPIMAAVAVIIRMDSPGPAVFFQPRCGRSRVVRGSELAGRTDIVPPHGEFQPDKLYYVPTVFRFMKFRTMYADARERFPELYRYKYSGREDFLCGYYKVENDPRVTRVGRWMRQITVDELPNFWHVLTGDVSLVGPRPEITHYVDYYTAEEMLKFTVRPGVTGLAQINGRGNNTIGRTLEYDLDYVRSRSVWNDVRIMFVTLWLVITRKGAF